jgi:PAS domain S-box-containing protein
VLRANPRAGELLGWTEAELLDLDPDVVLDPRDVRWRAPLDTRERAGVFRGVLRLRRRDGSTFSAHVTTAAVRDDESAGAHISFRDTTPTEAVGLIHRLGEWVLACAVEQAVRWAHLPDLRVWINVSPAQLADRGVAGAAGGSSGGRRSAR